MSDETRVTEPEARVAYIAMEHPRSTQKVRNGFIAQGRPVPGPTTFNHWCTKHKWPELAAAHDAKVAEDAQRRITREATQKVVTRARQFDTLAGESLQKAIDGLRNIDPEKLRPSDIRALTEVSERAAKMHELLEGRATDRTDSMDRQKLDRQLRKMQDELKDKIGSAPSVH